MDKNQLKPGDLVRIRAFGNKEIVRRFVGQDRATAHVCSEAEYDAASRAARAPECIGFPVEDVIGIEKHKTASAK